MRRTVIDTKRLRPASHIDTKCLPRKRCLKNTLPQVASKKETVRPIPGHRRQKTNLRDAEVLCLVSHDEVEWLGDFGCDSGSEPGEKTGPSDKALCRQTCPQ